MFLIIAIVGLVIAFASFTYLCVALPYTNSKVSDAVLTFVLGILVFAVFLFTAMIIKTI
jgi:hypothetical protein